MLDLLDTMKLCRAIDGTITNLCALYLVLVEKGLITHEEFLAAHERAVVMVKEEAELLNKGATNDERDNESKTTG